MVTKVSEITVSDVAGFIRLNELDDDEGVQLTAFLTVAKD